MQVGHTIWEEDDATTQRMIDINVNGVMFGVKEIVPRMLSRGRGHVVNIASTAGKGGFPGGGTYCGTKHYVVGDERGPARRAARHRHRGLLRHAGRRQHRARRRACRTTRGVKQIQPEDVANEIVSALKEARFDVFVPRSVAAITKVMNLLPRGGREGLSRALKADKVLIAARRRQARGLRAARLALRPGARGRRRDQAADPVARLVGG